MMNKTRQRGISLISGLLLVVIVAFIVLLAVRLFPVYFDYLTLSSVFNDVREQAGGESPAAIRDTLERRFEVNDVDVVSIRDVKIKPVRGGTTVSVHYEQRVPFVGNLSLLATFDKTVEVPAH